MFVLMGLWSPVIAMAEHYYVFDGKSLQPVDGDQGSVRAAKWEIWLYKTGESDGSQNHWGTISGTSSAEVVKELTSEQKFEKQWERFMGTSWGPYTYFNPLGPIAIVKPPKPLPAKIIKVMQDIRSVYSNLRTIFSLVSNSTDKAARTGQRNPFQGIGKVLVDYARNLQGATVKAAYLERQLNDINMPAEDKIGNWFATIQADLLGANEARPTIETILNENQPRRKRRSLCPANLRLTF